MCCCLAYIDVLLCGRLEGICVGYKQVLIVLLKEIIREVSHTTKQTKKELIGLLKRSEEKYVVLKKVLTVLLKEAIRQ